MTSPRLAYEDPSPTGDMVRDCEQVGRALLAAAPRHEHLGTPAAPVHGTPSVTDELASTAAGLHLHLH